MNEQQRRELEKVEVEYVEGLRAGRLPDTGGATPPVIPGRRTGDCEVKSRRSSWTTSSLRTPVRAKPSGQSPSGGWSLPKRTSRTPGWCRSGLSGGACKGSEIRVAAPLDDRLSGPARELSHFLLEP